MTENTVLNDDERRACQRIGINRPMSLELSSGERIEGLTEDISLGGVFFKTNVSLAEELLGQVASLQIGDGNQTSPSYPCRIARIIENNMGLELERDVMAAFGKELTKGMFRRK